MSNQVNAHAESDSGTCNTVEEISKNLSRMPITHSGGLADMLSQSIEVSTGISTHFFFVSTEQSCVFPKFDKLRLRYPADYVIYCFSNTTGKETSKNKECVLKQMGIAAVLIISYSDFPDDVMELHESVESFYSGYPRLATYADRIYQALLDALSANNVA